jgi:Arc/MetJ family transcription regulator
MNGPAIVVTGVGEAEGAKPLAAALACAGSEPDRAALLIEMTGGRAPRPALVASAAARGLEERLAAHLPEAGVASRGQLCHLTLPAGPEGLERAPAALALVRDSLGVVCLPPGLLGAAVETDGLRTGAALLRADLERDRALVALAVRDLLARGMSVAVAKRPLSWVPSRRALFGALPAGAPGGLAPRLLRRLAVGAPGAVVA